MRPECVVPEYQCAVKRKEKKAQKVDIILSYTFFLRIIFINLKYFSSASS